MSHARPAGADRDLVRLACLLPTLDRADHLEATTGDWLSLLATITLARRLSGSGTEGTAIAVVLATRIAPGFFLATAAGIIVDRFNRKRLLLLCDLGRAVVMFSLPFVDSLLGLVVASFLLEIFTMLWSPAKEAIVPNIVEAEAHHRQLAQRGCRLRDVPGGQPASAPCSRSSPTRSRARGGSTPGGSTRSASRSTSTGSRSC
ncbi:MAG: MFS transporter [Acidimicrobiales bacterium]